MLSLTNFKQEINLIIALGNIGNEYTNTKHNIGFMFADIFIDFFKEQGIVPHIKENKLYTLITFEELNCSIIKPKTYMNESGKALSDYLKNNSLKNSKDFGNKILIVHDDLDFKLGKYKIQMAKSPKQHNGIISIENHLHEQSANTYRLRIGIENREPSDQISGMNYVLSKFSQNELVELKNLFYNIVQTEFTF
jgi:PTH1 family peptidyl-tRNA hydrolase